MVKKIVEIRKFLMLCTVALIAAVGWACSADAEMMDGNFAEMESEYATAFGMLSENGSTITTDANVLLLIVEYGRQTSAEEVATKSGRVIVNYKILGNNPAGGFYIRLNRFYPLVVKDVMWFDSEEEALRSAMGSTPTNEWLDDNFVSLLDAPYMPSEVSVGGGYINVNINYLSVEERVPEVDLYFDVESSTEDTAVMQLVGKGSEDMYLSEASLRNLWFSYRVTERVKEELQDVGIYAFYWRWWQNLADLSEGTKEFVSVMSNDTFGGDASGRVIPLGE